MMAMTKS